MIPRDELEDWLTAAPSWLGRIIRSHIEALDLLEVHEAEAAALRRALEQALPHLREVAVEPSLLDLAMGQTQQGNPALEAATSALNSAAGHSLLSDFKALREQHARALGLLLALTARLSPATEGPDDPIERAQRALDAGSI